MMASLKRLCPKCGAANAMQRETCRDCGANMTSNLPVPLGDRLPVPWKEVKTSLVVGAGALALRAGVHLARYLLERKATRQVHTRAATTLPSRVRRWLPRRREAKVAPRSGAQVRFWGRRARARWRGDGIGRVEVEEIRWQATSDE